MRRNSAVAGNGRLELSASSSSSPSLLSSSSSARTRVLDSVSRRRSSSISSAPPGLVLSPRPSPSLPAVALRSLLAVDVWFSRRMALCAGKEAPLCGMRPLVKLVELTGHAAPWLAITLYLVICSKTAEEKEVMINLFLALLLDHAVVRMVKRAVNFQHSEWFATLFPQSGSFPSGHATRVAMCARFLHAHLLSDCPMRFVLLFWTLLLALTQVMLGQHNVSGVLLALVMGSCHYSMVETCWLSVERLQDVLFATLGRHVTQRG
ncbi:polyisoprenoid diphosphate/phosphate phosphohydrolase PLPP6-like [Tachysurus fulvidraco]|uniref:polyisoprenoid diphosphate/phosphate phosphohydrolase PLPP6-like n=1 Tax=Tachysurus fulvidraco TaxID=1234273 RepID=UPI001FEE0C56|nr:polyisoprenoid diphosphate/phosphate phosphohydrolase PLPP6-like [Tachysurus fulvidraco]